MPNQTPPSPFEDFATQAEQTRGIEPTQVRQLGNRRRFRRRLAVGASTLTVVAMAGAIAISQSGFVGQRDPGVAASPSIASPSTPPVVPTPTSTSARTPTPTQTPTRTPSPTQRPTASATSSPPSAPATSAAPSATDPSTSAPEPGPSGSLGTSWPGGSGPPAFNRLEVNAANLPSAEMIYGRSPGEDWETVVAAGWEAGILGRCYGGPLPNAQHVFSALYSTGGGESSAATGVVMDFATVEQATAARGQIAQWYAGCTSKGAITRYRTQEIAFGNVAGKGAANPVVGTAHRTFIPGSGGELSWSGDDVVIQTGARLMWIAHTDSGDSTCSVAAGSDQCSIYAAADELALRLMGTR